MESKKTVKKTVFYMYYFYKGKRERSQEFDSFSEFYATCGKWCSEHPDDWQLCKRSVYKTVG